MQNRDSPISQSAWPHSDPAPGRRSPCPTWPSRGLLAAQRILRRLLVLADPTLKGGDVAERCSREQSKDRESDWPGESTHSEDPLSPATTAQRQVLRLPALSNRHGWRTILHS